MNIYKLLAYIKLFFLYLVLAKNWKSKIKVIQYKREYLSMKIWKDQLRCAFCWKNDFQLRYCSVPTTSDLSKPVLAVGRTVLEYDVPGILLRINDCSLLWHLLVPIHGHSLAASAQFTVCWGRDWAAAVTNCRAFFECEQLLSTERFVMDLRSRLDEILKMRTGKEVSEFDEFAVFLVLDYSLGSTDIPMSLFQDFDNVPLITPQRFCRPRTCLPPTMMVFSEPTMANGIEVLSHEK